MIDKLFNVIVIRFKKETHFCLQLKIVLNETWAFAVKIEFNFKVFNQIPIEESILKRKMKICSISCISFFFNNSTVEY